MTIEELDSINLSYKKNPENKDLLIYIPMLLKYINELQDEIVGIDHYINSLDI